MSDNDSHKTIRDVVRASEAVATILKGRFPNLTTQETVVIVGQIVQAVLEATR